MLIKVKVSNIFQHGHRKPTHFPTHHCCASVCAYSCARVSLQPLGLCDFLNEMFITHFACIHSFLFNGSFVKVNIFPFSTSVQPLGLFDFLNEMFITHFACIHSFLFYVSFIKVNIFQVHYILKRKSIMFNIKIKILKPGRNTSLRLNAQFVSIRDSTWFIVLPLLGF